MKEQKKSRGIFEKHLGTGVWWIRYTDGSGRYRREVAGSWAQARDLLKKRHGEALQRKKLPETLRVRVVSFDDLADAAIAHIKKSYARAADDLARMELLKKHFSGPADAVTASEVKRVLNALTAEKRWAASTRNHHHNLVSLAYRLGIEDEKVGQNPASAVRREKEDNNRVRFLTPEEERKLREAIRSKPEWAEHELELDLALHSGLRRGSMYLSLSWENVDLAARVATIPKTKNGDRVVVPLNDVAMRAMLSFRSRGDGTGRVVRNAAGEVLNYNAHWFVPAVRAAGIKDFRWHDCRHTYASRLRQTGTPLGNIAELLGHRGLAMAKRYAHLSISNLHEAVSRISNSTTLAPEPIAETQAVSYVH
jgi:integrase